MANWSMSGPRLIPLNLYSLGSSFFFGMLNDDDALDPAKLDRCDVTSEGKDGR